MNFKCYDIYLADLNPTQGAEISKIRPVVVVSPDGMNQALETVVVCPLTTQLHPRWRTRLQIRCAGKKAEIALDQIRAISQQRFTKRIDRLSESDVAQVRRLLAELYGDG
jgi:mRNA interferase MazF